MQNPEKWLGGRYRLLHPVGSGATGQVFLAYDRFLNKKWAIKRISVNGRFANDLLAETSFVKKLRHPMLPKVADLFCDEDAVYIVMDYIPGETLAERILREGKMEAEEAVKVAVRLCKVLLFLHFQTPAYIYRDLKPENLIYDAAGNLMLVDLGAVVPYGRKNNADCVGTPGYAAPEQYKMGSQIDRRADIYSLGMVLYHLLTGKAPVRMRNPVTSIKKEALPISRKLRQILIKCIAKRPDRRYADCLELMSDLEMIIRGK